MTYVQVHVTNNSDQECSLLLDDERDAERIDYLKKLARREDLASVKVEPVEAAPKAKAPAKKAPAKRAAAKKTAAPKPTVTEPGQADDQSDAQPEA